jgi:hypothetical protein
MKGQSRDCICMKGAEQRLHCWYCKPWNLCELRSNCELK